MDYKLINFRTVMNKGIGESGLSFVEGERDIPFPINRMYFIYQSEEALQKGFYIHKQSWHLFFCPNGIITVAIDNGTSTEIVRLDSPSKGLILCPGVWRDIKWSDPNSVLCVAASGHYEADKYRRDYNLYLKSIEDRKSSIK